MEFVTKVTSNGTVHGNAANVKMQTLILSSGSLSDVNITISSEFSTSGAIMFADAVLNSNGVAVIGGIVSFRNTTLISNGNYSIDSNAIVNGTGIVTLKGLTNNINGM